MDYATIAAATITSHRRRRKPADKEKIPTNSPAAPSLEEEVFVPAQHPLAAPAVMKDPTQLPDVITWSLPSECKRIYVVFSANAYTATKLLIKKIVYQDPSNRYLFGMQYADPNAPAGSDAAIPNAALVVDGSAWGQLSKQSPHMIVWQLFCGRQDLSLLEMPAIVVIGMPFACDTRCLIGSSKGKKTAFIDTEERMLTVMASCAPFVSPVFQSAIVYRTIFNASTPCTSCGTDLLSGGLTAATCSQGHTACAACVVKAGKKCPAKVFSGKGLESFHRCGAKMRSVSPGTPKRVMVNTSREEEEEEEEEEEDIGPPPPILHPAPVPIAQRPPVAAEPVALEVKAAEEEEEPVPRPVLDWDDIEAQMKTFALPIPTEPEPEPEPEEEQEQAEIRRSRRKRDARNGLFNLPDPNKLGHSVKPKSRKRPAHLEAEEADDDDDDENEGYALRNGASRSKPKPKPKPKRRRKKAEQEQEQESLSVDALADYGWGDDPALQSGEPLPHLFGDQAHILQSIFIPVSFETALPPLPIDDMLAGF